MRRASLLIVVIVMLVGLVAFLGSQVPPVGAARPYEGQTIRAVVNAEYVKYSLSLVEKDLYDKLGVKIETEVIPLDAFVSKTLLEFNSGSSPWDLVMFGPSNMPDYGRHFEPLEPWMQKLKLDFAVEDIELAARKLREAGARVDDIKREDWGSAVTSYDPDGYRISLYQPPRR